jgi:hypothetical protein
MATKELIDNIQMAGHRYRWQENWTTLPNSDAGWAHHGLAVCTNNRIVTGHASLPELYVMTQEGSIEKSFELNVSDIHHITVKQEPTPRQNEMIETLLVCDIGNKDLDDTYQSEPKVIEITLTGKPVNQITKKHLGYATNQPFKPTSTTYDKHNNRLWISDGYGSNLVHCLNADGTVAFQLDGTTGAGLFNCPHTAFIDERSSPPVVHIADRSNHRVQTFTLEGDFVGCLEVPTLKTPSAFATLGEYLLVVELEARLLVLDANNNLVNVLFDGNDYTVLPGWPNRIVNHELSKPTDLISGKLNSPHSICIDQQNNIYISEWCIGDRFIKLERITS